MASVLFQCGSNEIRNRARLQPCRSSAKGKVRNRARLQCCSSAEATRFVTGHGFSRAGRPERKPALAAARMSKPSRHSNPDAILSRERTFFVTSNILGGKCLFQSPAPPALFIKTVYEYRAQNKFRLHAFVVMPDH